MEKKTLEDVAKLEAFEFKIDYKPFETDLDYREYAEYGFEKGFISGVEWQAERMYDELFQWLASKDYLSDELLSIQKEFEQFKKK